MRLLTTIYFCILLSVVSYPGCAFSEPLPFRFAQASEPGQPLPTAEQFKRMYDFVVNGREDARLPWQIAVPMGWTTARKDLPSWRRGLTQRRSTDGALLREYAVDVTKLTLPRPVLVIFQMIPGDPEKNIEADTTICFVFDESGRIVRTFEMYPKLNYKVEERYASFDKLGYQIWRFLIYQMDKDSK